MPVETTELLQRLGVALAIGLLIGIERGWKTRDLTEGARVAGVRTFGVMGLLGGLSALLSELASPLVLAAAMLGLGGFIAINHWFTVKQNQDVGTTTLMAALAVFALGALAGFGQLAVAGATGVVLTLLLGLKPELHHVVERMAHRELMAVLQLLLISVVLLPVLPDQGYGPFQALNPYRIWWMVVLIAGLSFLGYLAMRLVGATRGVLLTGLLGGMASSTATAINLARFGRHAPADAQRLLAAGAVAAVATMYPRVLIVVAVVEPVMVPHLAAPLLLAAVVALGGVAWRWRHGLEVEESEKLQPRNPFELGVALQFGVLLALVMLLARALQAWAGDAGLYALAAASGLGDVDAITLSLAAMLGDGEIGARVAVIGAVIGAAANTVVKPALVAVVGAPRMALAMLPPLGAALLAAGAGLSVLALTPG